MLLVMAAKVLGFGEKLVLAHQHGTTASVDAYFTALNIGFVLFVLVDDVLVPVFLTRYVRLTERSGGGAAFVYFWRVFGVTAALLLIATLVIEISPVPVLRLVAPGFEGERLVEATAVLRWTAPGGLLLGLAASTYVVLNAHQRFAWPAAAGVLYKGVLLAGIVVLLPALGIVGAGIAMFVAALAQLAMHFWGLSRCEMRAGPDKADAQAPDGPSTLRLALPLAVGTLVAQLSGFVDNAWGSKLPEGSIAALGYARRLVDLPILLVPGVLGIVAFPRLAALAARHQTQALVSLLGRLIGLCAVLFVPATVVLLLAPEVVVDLVFGRGRFDTAAIELTGRVLLIFSLGFVAYAVEILVLRAFYATLDTWTPMAIGLVFVSVNIAMTITLTPKIGIIAIPLALVTQKVLKGVVLGVILVRRYGLEPGWKLPAVLWRFAACGAVFSVTFAGGLSVGDDSVPTTALGLFASAAIAAATYLAALFGLGLLDPRRVMRFVRSG